MVDQTFRQQTLDNKVRFSAFTPTSSLFLPGGDAPAVGSVFRNPDLADTYLLLGKQGLDAFYGGQLAEEMEATVQAPPKDPAWVPPVTDPPTSIPALPGLPDHGGPRRVRDAGPGAHARSVPRI